MGCPASPLRAFMRTIGEPPLRFSGSPGNAACGHGTVRLAQLNTWSWACKVGSINDRSLLTDPGRPGLPNPRVLVPLTRHQGARVGLAGARAAGNVSLSRSGGVTRALALSQCHHLRSAATTAPNPSTTPQGWTCLFHEQSVYLWLSRQARVYGRLALHEKKSV